MKNKKHSKGQLTYTIYIIKIKKKSHRPHILHFQSLKLRNNNMKKTKYDLDNIYESQNGLLFYIINSFAF